MAPQWYSKTKSCSKRCLAALRSRPSNILPHFLHNLKAGGDLPAHTQWASLHALLLADTSCNCEEAHIRVQGRSLRHTYILSKACIHLICVTARDTKNASSGHGKEAHLPCKQQKIQRVEGDVGCARSLIALRHGRHQGGCSGPQHYDGSSSIQVRTGEQLPCKQSSTLMWTAAQRPADDAAHDGDHLLGTRTCAAWMCMDAG